jgi:predicted  nucleic acid-binding Zn-ribbon protein
MLNWRRDPDYERRMNALAIRIQQTKNDTERIEREILQTEKETEQLRQENARYRQQRAREKAWRRSVEQFFSQPESNSTPQAAIEPASEPSSP